MGVPGNDSSDPDHLFFPDNSGPNAGNFIGDGFDASEEDLPEPQVNYPFSVAARPWVGERLRNHAIAALVANTIAICLFLGFVSVAGVICAGLALRRADGRPDAARRLTVWAWALFVASITVSTLLTVTLLVEPAAHLVTVVRRDL